MVLAFLFGLRQVEGFSEAEHNPKQAVYRYLLKSAQEVLDNLEIPFFLSSGTCLGYVRERNFIEHDYDIDVGVNAVDVHGKIGQLINAMTNKGLYLYRILGTLQSGLELSFYMPDAIGAGTSGAKIDVFVHDDKDDQTCWHSYNLDKDTKLRYCVSKFGLKQVDFLGLRVNVPDPAIQYLEEHYGKDWRIPKRVGIDGYRYDSSPISLVKF